MAGATTPGPILAILEAIAAGTQAARQPDQQAAARIAGAITMRTATLATKSTGADGPAIHIGGHVGGQN